MSWLNNGKENGTSSKQHPKIEIEELHNTLKSIIDQIAQLNLDVKINPQEFGEEGVEILLSLQDMQSQLAKMSGGISSDTNSLKASAKELDESAANMLSKSQEISSNSKTVAQDTCQMSENLSNISAAAEELNVTIKHISDNAEASTDNINIVTTATEEMTSTVQEIAHNTETARTVTEEAVKSVEAVTKTVLDLENAANEINNVITSITEISDLTKLLALNATIEAARAGEAGKGFAVVASEVKDLAQQTNVAAADISQKIQTMQKATKSTTTEVEAIKEVINNVSNIVSTIATAAEEQSATTQDIAMNLTSAASGINDVNVAVKESVLAVEDVSESINNISALADSISGAINDVSSSCIDIRSDSTYLYANAIEVTSRGEDINKCLSQIELPEEIKKQLSTISVELFKFTEAYSVLIIEMDTEHKAIINYINKIHSGIKERKTDQDLLPIIKDLADYTTKHFRHEEEYMAQGNYPDIEEQKISHVKLLEKVSSVITQIENNEEVNLIDVMLFLKSWLQTHILKMDAKYGQYFKEKGLLDKFNEGKVLGQSEI